MFYKAFTSLLLLLSTMPLSAKLPNTIQVEQGQLKGKVENGISVFRGIPFAKPPVGKLRWTAPQPPDSWDGVLNAYEYKPVCPQPGRPASAMSEDCLYLNVWTPANLQDEKLPVMVWIYGGGFSVGAASDPVTEGDQLAPKGVILVTIAYRVGPLGFLAHPELSAESPNGVSGNYGILDQIEALKWVKQNIAQFGGDPQNVTIFGESAGGISVSILAASPQAKGLFQKAISESGGSFWPPAEERMNDYTQDLKGAEAAGLRYEKALKANSIEEMRALTPKEVLEGAMAGRIGFWPIIDGYVSTDDPYVLYQKGDFNDVSILVGTNSDEGNWFPRPPAEKTAVETSMRKRFGPFADRMLELYPLGDEKTNLRALADLFEGTGFAWPTWTWARLQTQHGNAPVYLYYMDQPQPRPDRPLLIEPNGTPHGADVCYVFEHLDLVSDKFTDADRKLSAIMSQYWVNFAKYGNPNGADLPEWPQFTPDSDNSVMYLKTNPSTGPVPDIERMQALEDYFDWKRSGADLRGTESSK